MEIDNFSIVVPVDYLLHTLEKPFCYDDTCSCKENQEAIQVVWQWVQEGLMTPDEATNFILGRTF